MATDYKTVFQLAQDKGYNYTTSSTWKQMLEAFKYGITNTHGTLSDHNLAAFRTFFLNNLPDLINDIQKWLRDEHKIVVVVSVGEVTKYGWLHCTTNGKLLTSINGNFTSYESALLEGIHEALKLI